MFVNAAARRSRGGFRHLLTAAVLACLILLLGGVPGRTEPVLPLTQPQLAARLDALITGDAAMQRAVVGIAVNDLQTGASVYARQADTLMTPASIQKLLTTAAALDLLGPGDAPLHRIRLRGRWLAPGVLDGAVELATFGDPLLDSTRLTSTLETLVSETGLKSVTGNIVLAAHKWPTGKGPGWMWDDEPAPFSARINKAMLDFNTVLVRVDKAAGQSDRAIRLTPPTSYPPVRWWPGNADLKTLSAPMLKQLTPAERRDYYRAVAVSAQRPSEQDAIEIRGIRFPSAVVETRVSVRDPDRYILSVAKAALDSHGVSVGGLVVLTPEDQAQARPGQAGTTAAIGSLPELRELVFAGATLADVITHTNKESENAAAEMLLLALGERLGKGASWQAGASVVADWLTSRVGIEKDAFFIKDGSGLSRYNLVAPAALNRLLRYMAAHRHFDLFRQSLPVYAVGLGKGDTFNGQGASSFPTKRVFAKPGGMAGVSTISGYMQTFSGHWLAVTIMTNGNNGTNRHARAQRNAIWRELARYQPPRGDAQQALLMRSALP